jgi:NTE family protein
MSKKLAIVLGGGGARGALQVGALRALFEAGYNPEILVGTSIGAANAAFLAIRGTTPEAIRELVTIYRDAAKADLLPSNYLWLTLRTLFSRPDAQTIFRIRDFFINHGIPPDMRFGDLQRVKLILVAADLNNRCQVLFGANPDDSILQGVLASAALPPWVAPIENEEQLLVDGGVISNLPIEAAMTTGVSEIIALDLEDPRDSELEGRSVGVFFSKLANTVQKRQLDLEMAMAVACGVNVRHIQLYGSEPIPVWDFRHWEELIARGFEIAQRDIATWEINEKPWWRRLFS